MGKALESFDLLAGEWRMEAVHPVDPSLKVEGRVAFEWLEGRSFLVQRWTVEHPDFPNGIAIIGCEESGCSMHYFDSRGVSRVYGTSLSERTWKLWRESPGFWQRFVGELGNDGDKIASRWEKSTDGSEWEIDFHVTYTKVT
jgi:hypothetical protein